ncbi:DUF3971 domain-containing protein [Hirschia litorea]|uniref:DUF3971 domain-containing protein n=1 Tax=Hirschia litorea TaxID=1199156 RepID=A0ABW2IHL8_9PROT
MKFSIRMLILELLALIVLATIVAAGLLAWRLSKGPLDMDVLRPQVEAALSEARGGNAVEIDSLALAWSPDKKRIEATVGGITTYTAENNIDAKAKSGAVWFETAALLRGKFNIIKFRLEDGYTGLHRDKQGNWKIVSPNIDVFDDKDEPSPLKTDTPMMLQWRDWIPQLREHVETQSFQEVEFSNFDIKLTDGVTGLNWQIKEVSGIWTADSDGLMMDLSGDFLGEDAPNAVQMRFSSDPVIENFSIELGISGADPERLAALITKESYPLQYNGVVDLKIGATANELDGLLTAQISGAGENGNILLDETEYVLDSVSFETLFDFKKRRVDLTELNLKSQKLKGEFSGLADVTEYFNGTSNPKIPFEFQAKNIWVDIQPMFSSAWDIKTFDVNGVVDTDTLAVEIESASGGLENFKGNGSGRLYLEPKMVVDPDTPPKSLGSRLGVELKATGEGSVSPQDVLRFWPVKLGSVGRVWAKNNVLEGRATSLNFRMDFPPGTTSKSIVPDKHLTLDFAVEGAKVTFLEDLPAIENASGTGRLRGNSLQIDLASGEFGGWKLSDGEVRLPAFHPAGAISTYKASGQGDLKGLMKILEGSRLNTCSEYGLACDKMNGFGSLDVSIKRPMKKGTTAEDIVFDVRGGFVDANAPDLASGFGLEKTDVTVELDNEHLEIKGAGRFGGAPADFTWQQLFETEKGTSLIANAIVSPDLLNSLGIAARSIMQGEADLQLEAYGDGRDFDSIDMHVDFTGAALNLSEIGWLKPLYVPATGELRYGKAANGESILTGDIVAKGLKLAGELNFLEGQGLQRATIERIYSENRMDMRGDLSRTSKGDVKINVSGPFFDASPWIDGLTQLDGGGVGPGVNVSANIAVDKLKLREDAELLNSKIVMDFNPKRLQRGLVSGTIERGKGIEATFERDGEDIAFQLRSDDAGYVLRTLLKTDYLTGGTLSMSGLMGKDLGTAEMNMRNVRLKGAPVLAEIFALASLRGLTDVLNGDGVMFTEIQAPIRFKKGRLELPGVRASGPAMGLTTRGWLEMETGNLSLDGVVVPSFGVNSALGGIPIIGDLFVSRQGEGVFAVTYSVRGALERARVSINPLSAVTPGFLRRIMENPSQEPDEDS